MNPSTAGWLADNVTQYPNSHRVYLDIEHVLSRFPTIRPKSDVYTYDDGRTQLLLCLHGLLPISYKDAAYNIPIAIWLPLDYPQSPPISYVIPTSTMLVRPGNHLDPSGRSNLPYLQHWSRKPEACSLILLIQSLQQDFSLDPPLYTKPKQSQSQIAEYRPPLPPKPQSQSPPSTTFSPSLHTPPIPSFIPIPNPPHVPQPHPVPPPQDLLDQDIPDSSSNHVVSAPPPPRPPNPELLQLHAQVYNKLTSELTSLSQSMATDSDRLRTQQSSLLAGEPAIRDEMARLEAVRDVCRTVACRISQTVSQAESSLGELRRKGDPEVDELVCSTSIVHNQLINLVAEDNAIEDTIYHLHRSLNMGRIDLERFLRTTRVLAEEQFMKRALIEKIHSGLAIGASVHSTSGWP